MRHCLTILFLLVFLCLEAQPLFTLTPSEVFASKPASNFTMYNYAQFDNLSGDTLAMRWVKTQTTIIQSGGHGGEGFGDWTVSLQDPINFYNPANDVDSADFVLMPSSSSTDKFILQLYPNGQEGTLLMTFKIFALSDPDNFVEVKFDYTATPSMTADSETVEVKGIDVFPSPASGWVSLRNNADDAVALRLFSENGQYLSTILLGARETNTFDISQQPLGVYYFVYQTNTNTFIKRFIKN